MSLYYEDRMTPCGPVRIVVETDGSLVALHLTRESADDGGAPVSRYSDSYRGEELIEDSNRTLHVAKQLAEYFAGRLRSFELSLAPRGSDFQLRVWDELTRIPYGSTISYAQLAERLGDPLVIRAAARANGANPIWLIVPCHRVIGSDGRMVGYGGGLSVKRWLLEHEGALQPQLFSSTD